MTFTGEEKTVIEKHIMRTWGSDILNAIIYDQALFHSVISISSQPTAPTPAQQTVVSAQNRVGVAKQVPDEDTSTLLSQLCSSFTKSVRDCCPFPSYY